jgi:hypothetical protein
MGMKERVILWHPDYGLREVEATAAEMPAALTPLMAAGWMQATPEQIEEGGEK